MDDNRTSEHIVELDQHVLDHIKTEFGSEGERAIGFLQTAQSLLNNTDLELAQLGEVVAYCLREGMRFPLSTQEDEDKAWQVLTRKITRAKTRYENLQDIPAKDKKRALDELLDLINDLEQFHVHGKSIYEERLKASLLWRTGTKPRERDIQSYLKIRSESNTALHGNIEIDKVIQLWNKGIELINHLFLPPGMRRTEMQKLAGIDNPTKRDLEVLSDLMATPQHAQMFFTEKLSMNWLNLIVVGQAFDPPSNSEGIWPGFIVVDSFGKKAPIAIADWLTDLEERFGHNLIQAWFIARAALRALEMGSPTHQVLYKLLRQHKRDRHIVHHNIQSMAYIKPEDRRVEEVADIVLNENFWSNSGVIKPVLDNLIEGINTGNIESRLRLLCFKIKGIDTNDYWKGTHEDNYTGSIVDWKYDREEGRFTRLIVYLIKAISKAQQIIDTDSLLSMIDTLTGIVHSRTRAWILSKAEDVGSDTLINEISKAIGKRYPTGDDLLLLDRIIKEVDPELYINRWRESLGPAPSISEVGQSLASNDTSRWYHIIGWLDILPEEILGKWTNPATILWSQLGRRGRRELMTQQPVVEVNFPQSPFSIEELENIIPLEVAQKIANWRPDPSDWTTSANRLATILQAVIKNNPSEWLSNPIALVSGLHHPTYIDHYLRSVLEIIREQRLPIDTVLISELVDVILLVYSTPWQPTSLDTPIHRDYDQNWRGAKRATGELIRELANNNTGFTDRNNEVWNMLKGEVQDISEPLEYKGDEDMLFIAINRNCTQALQTVFSLITYEYQNREYVRPDALELLEYCLKVDWPDGGFYRAIIASQINLLLYIAPEWVKENEELLLGTDAPGDLGQLTIDLALEWGQPNQWLFENNKQEIEDAVKRGVKRSLNHLLIAMLWELPGYSIHETTNYLLSLEKFPQETGLTISKLISGKDVDKHYRERAIQFWSILIDRARGTKASNILGGFSWMVSVEFPDLRVWAEMTLQTLTKTGGKIEVPWQVAEYAAQIEPSITTLAIMNLLLRESNDEIGLQYMILKQAKLLIEKSDSFKDTDDYLHLHTAVSERGGFRDLPS